MQTETREAGHSCPCYEQEEEEEEEKKKFMWISKKPKGK